MIQCDDSDIRIGKKALHASTTNLLRNRTSRCTIALTSNTAQSISITSGSSSTFSSALSSIMRPSSSSLRFLLGVKGAAPVSATVLLRFAAGVSISSISSGRRRFFEDTGVDGVGARGLTFFGGFGKGDGRINAGASTGWLGLRGWSVSQKRTGYHRAKALTEARQQQPGSSHTRPPRPRSTRTCLS